MKRNYERPEFAIITVNSESVLDVSANPGNGGWEDKPNEIL